MWRSPLTTKKTPSNGGLLLYYGIFKGIVRGTFGAPAATSFLRVQALGCPRENGESAAERALRKSDVGGGNPS